MSKRKKTKNETRLIVAASEHDPDMLYATKFFVPDPFIFLEQGGKRTIVLKGGEIAPGQLLNVRVLQATAGQLLGLPNPAKSELSA